MFYPLFIDLRDQPVLVVGGGEVAERKVDPLLEAGAAVALVAPEVTPGIQALAQKKAIHLHRREFDDSDIDGARLVISATDDTQTQNRVANAARSRGVMVNTVDQPALCDFIVPAVVRRGDVIVAISTSGKSPTLAAALRGRVENVVTADAARAVRILGEIRGEVHSRFPNSERRKQVFQQIVDSGILDWISECDDAAALQRVRGMLEKLR